MEQLIIAAVSFHIEFLMCERREPIIALKFTLCVFFCKMKRTFRQEVILEGHVPSSEQIGSREDGASLWLSRFRRGDKSQTRNGKQERRAGTAPRTPHAGGGTAKVWTRERSDAWLPGFSVACRELPRKRWQRENCLERSCRLPTAHTPQESTALRVWAWNSAFAMRLFERAEAKLLLLDPEDDDGVSQDEEEIVELEMHALVCMRDARMLVTAGSLIPWRPARAVAVVVISRSGALPARLRLGTAV